MTAHGLRVPVRDAGPLPDCGGLRPLGGRESGPRTRRLATTHGRPCDDLRSTIYLLHFDRSYKHARHYLGYTENLEQRLEQRRAGHGSPLVAAAIAAGISFEVTWPGDRNRERPLHHYKNSRARLCPICRADLRAAAAVAHAEPRPGPPAADEVLVRVLSELAGPVTLPALYTHLRRLGHDRVGSVYGRLELLAATGRIGKSQLLGEIASTAR